MEEVSAKLSPHAEMVKRRMELSATLIANRDSTVLDLSAGNIAPASSVMMALSATSPLPMAVELDTLFGMKVDVTETTLSLAVRSGASSGTPSAELTSTMLHAAFAHQIAHLA